MKKTTLVNIILLLIISNAFTQNKQGNTLNAEIFADTPYRIKKTDEQGNLKPIPIHIFAHDADAEGFSILLMSIDISIKNADDTSFGSPILFNDFSLLQFNSLIVQKSLSNSDLDIKDFESSMYQQSANHTIEFKETNYYISGTEYVDIDSKYWYFTILIPEEKLQGFDDNIDIKVYFNIDWSVDDETELRVFRTDYDIPKIENWYRGDVHYHALFTQNSAEIGLPLEATKLVAKEVGLDWITTTDHSCDFDNYGVSTNSNWTLLQSQIQNLNNEDGSFVFIPAMEMSVNNSEGKIIHALTYPSENSVFSLPYLGDGGGDLSSTTVTSIKLLDTLSNYGGFCYMAHPFAEGDEISFAVDGSVWNLNDAGFPENGEAHQSAGTVICNNTLNPSDIFSYNANELFKSNLVGGQIWNLRNTMVTSDQNYNPWNVQCDTNIAPFSELAETETANHIFRLNQNFDVTNFLWTKGLIEKNNNLALQNWKFFISAGSDAHGSFNYSNTDLAYGIGDISDNAIGKLSTLIYSENGMGSNGENILKAMKNGTTILSSGPIVNFGISKAPNNTLPEILIGSDTVLNYLELSDYNLIVNSQTSNIFGNIESVNLIIVTENNTFQYPLNNAQGVNSYNIETVLTDIFGNNDIPVDKYFMMRIELKTIKNYGSLASVYNKNSENFRSFTNPIWVKFNSLNSLTENMETEINIYPNPANSILNIRVNANLVGKTCVIIDVLGNVLLTENLTSVASQINIDNLANGIYFLRLNNNIIKKFIKN